MQPELALERLNEVREVVDGDVEEMVDGLAKVVMLQQDMSNPMLGAKVTLYLRPETESYMIPEEEAPEGWKDDWQYALNTSDEEYWGKWDFEWYNEEPEDPDTVIRFDKKVNEDDPDLLPREAIVIESDVSGSAPEGELWDPNRKEYKTADEYPLGTVNVVVAKDRHKENLEDFTDGYCTDVEVYTSIVPADGDPTPNSYTPGWN